MALLDLSLVTQTLTTLLERRLPLFQDWPSVATATISPAPPDLVNGDYALSVYLYHVREDAHAKSQDLQIGDKTPHRFQPMAVTLHYVLCPRSSATDIPTRFLNDQLVFGLALRTLHDYPFIDDQTMIDDGMGGLTQAMPLGLRGRNNRLRITLRPTPVEEAGQYWQSGTQSVRLAAYYEVAATLLEPDEILSKAGRVLAVGVHTFLRGQPVIAGTRNEIVFTVPGDPTPRSLVASPAEVVYGGRLTVFGSDLKGDATALLINHPDFPEPVEADAAWNLQTDGGTLTVDVQPSASGQTLAPGIYGASVRTVARRALPDGSTRDFPNVSNIATFAIVPAIVGVAFDGAGLGTIVVNNFDPTLLTGNALMLFAGATRLSRVTAAPNAGEFRALAAPPTPRLEFRLPAGVPAGVQVPIRILARSAESAPLWVTAP